MCHQCALFQTSEKIILRDKYVLETYMRLLYSLMIITNISEEDILAIVHDINQKDINFLKLNNMTEIFASYLHEAKKNFNVVFK